MSSCLADLLWPLLRKRHVADVWDSSTLYPWEEQYPLGSNLCPLLGYTLRYWLEIGSDGVELLDTRCHCPAVVYWCPNFLIRSFSDCAVASFAVRWATWLDISDIVFVSSATDVLSACVVLMHLGENFHISLCSVYVRCIAFGIWSSWGSPIILEGPSKVSLEFSPCFVTLCLARLFLAIVVI